MPEKIRIGIIGAGGYSKSRHIPGFQKLPDVEVVAVANRSVASAKAVTDQFGIAEALDDWHKIIERDDIDAVLIGTTPNVHREITLAALEAGKHVICQTRIAPTPEDALAMYNAAEAARDKGILTMLIPPGPNYRGRKFIKHLVESGLTGKLRHVMSFNLNDSFADNDAPLTNGRNDPELYGPYHGSSIGLAYDTMLPWTGPATRIMAHRKTYVPERPQYEGGPIVKAPYPEEATVIAETESGAVLMNVMNAAVHFGESRFEIYGEEGTVIYQGRGDTIMAARKGDEKLQPLAIPPEHDNPWLIEQEFISLLRGEVKEPSFTFWDGVLNARYLEGAYRSATTGGGWVDLP